MSHPLPDVRDGLSLVHRRVLLALRDAVIARRIQADGTSADDSTEKRMRLIKDDLTRIADAYGDDRRTEIRGER
jgi:DNA gyrase/topoisomerase IV subunit A